MFIRAISTAPLQVHYYLEVLLTQHGYCVIVSRRSATGNCKWRTYRRSLPVGFIFGALHSHWWAANVGQLHQALEATLGAPCTYANHPH